MKQTMLFVALVLSFVGGWYASSTLQKAGTTSSQATPQTSAITNAKTIPEVEPVDIYSGTGLTPNKLYDTLNTLSGVDFDRRYINYVILLQSDLAGINRLAKEKAVASALGAKATELWNVDTDRLTALYTLQRSLGYTHH